MEEKSEFYTLKGYQIKNHDHITESMEDYLEMIFRHLEVVPNIRIKTLANELNVRPSSVSKMITRLEEVGFVSRKHYGDITLTERGYQIGKYLLWRHNVLKDFLQTLNRDQYQLEQVEKIEHFIDHITLVNMELFNQKNHSEK